MNVPKIIVKEKNNKLVCTLVCVLVPVMLGILIYEIIILIRCKCNHEEYSMCPDMEDSDDDMTEGM